MRMLQSILPKTACLLAGLLVLMFYPIQSHGDTAIPGGWLTTQTWTMAGSPYNVADASVWINSGQTLTIEPGVIVRFGGMHSGIQFFGGSIQAIGSAELPISFTTTNPTLGWDGIEWNSGTASRFEHCILEYARNSSTSGGLFRMDGYSGLTVENCIIRYNRAARGGALYIHGGSAMFRNTIFLENYATATTNGAGGAVYAYQSSPRFISCLFQGNYAQDMGGAIHGYYYVTPILLNCTLVSNRTTVGNDSNSGGGAINLFSNSGVNIRNSILWGNYNAGGGWQQYFPLLQRVQHICALQ